jgi:broad specificity phosphatase PhoE
MHGIRAGLALLILYFATAANPVAAAEPEWLEGLRQGGHVIVFRHGPTFTNQADTDPLNMANVAAQRQLSEEGRVQAMAIGTAMHRLGIPVSMVITSTFQRAVDTGTLLGFGTVTASADVAEGGLVVSPDENNRRARALRKLAATPPATGGDLVVVSHKPNLMDAFGKDWFDVREGEASVFKPDGAGGSKLVVRIQASEWSKLAETMR